MSVQEISPLGDRQPRPRLTAIEGDGESGPDNWMAGPKDFRVQVFKGTPREGPKDAIRLPDFSWKLNNDLRGVVDWDLVGTSGTSPEGVIDSIDAIPDSVLTPFGEVKMRRAGWRLISICMHHLNSDILVIHTPVGKMEFNEDHEVRLH